MKKILLFVLPCFVLFAGCNKEITETSSEEYYYTVKLSVGGEITTSESPLTKSGESDALFGIWVGKDGSGQNNYFAGGLFDNTDDIVVNFLAGHTYAIFCSLVSNGKTVVPYKNTSSQYGTSGYGYPFGYSYYASSSGTIYQYTPLNNRLGYKGIDPQKEYGYNMNSNTEYRGITDPSIRTANRYFWKVTEYTPTENGTLNVELKHTVVGVKYRISGLVDGSIALTIKIGDDTVISESAISSNGESEGAVFECSDILGAYDYPNTYKETARVSLVWTRGIGVDQNLGYVDVDLLRNRMNIININLGADDGDAALGINVDQTDMTNESVTIEAS